MRRIITFGLFLISLVLLTFSATLPKLPQPETMKEINQSVISSSNNETESESADAKIPPDLVYPDYRDGLSANIKDNSPELVHLLERLKEESPGVAGWLVGYADNDKVIFYNHAHMLAYNIKNRHFVSAIDLLSIDANHIQGSVVTEFAFSPNGDHVIINNGMSENQPGWTAKMYLGDVQTGAVREIALANSFRIVSSWSPNAQYFAFADRAGTNVTVYDVLTGAKNVIGFGQGEIKRILVTNNGGLVIEASSIFLMAPDKGYKLIDLGITGNILALQGSEILYFNGKNVLKCNPDSGQNSVLQNLPEGLMLRGVIKEQAVFTPASGSTSYVYNLIDNKVYHYGYSFTSFPGLTRWSFSPDSQYCVVPDGQGYRVIDGRGKEEKIQTNPNEGAAFDCDWIDNNTFVAVIIKAGAFKAGNFEIVAYDLKAKQRKILYEQ